MATLSNLQNEILRKIFTELKPGADDSQPDLTFYNLTYVNRKFRLIAWEIFHDQNSARWNKKARTRRMVGLRKEEAYTVFANTMNPLSTLPLFERRPEGFLRAPRVRQNLLRFEGTWEEMHNRLYQPSLYGWSRVLGPRNVHEHRLQDIWNRLQGWYSLSQI